MNKLMLWMGIGACATSIANASLAPSWAGDHGSVYAEWSNWAGFSIGGGTASDPDYFEVIDPSGSVRADVPGQDDADAEALAALYYNDSDGSGLQITQNYDLSFWMPSFAGFNTQEAVIQLTYWDDQSDPDWRAGFDLGITLHGGSGSQVAGPITYLGEELDGLGRITQAWGFTVNNSADGFFVDIAASDASLVGGLYLDSAAIDTISYDAVPEPASAVSMLVGGVILACMRKRARC